MMDSHQPANVFVETNPTSWQEWAANEWIGAAKAFRDICDKSLVRDDVNGFDDVLNIMDRVENASHGNAKREGMWQKIKDFGLHSLKLLKILIGAATQAASLGPIPSPAANLVGSALCFVIEIPIKIHDLNVDVGRVIDQMISTLAQFQIYQSMEEMKPELIQPIHLVLISFVKLCAYVVKYRQGGRMVRFGQQMKSLLEGNTDIAVEMTKFKSAVQKKREVETTLTLVSVVNLRQDIAEDLEKCVKFADEKTDKVLQVLRETQKGLQSLTDDADRGKILTKIRDTLGVSATVRLDSNTTQTCTNYSNKCSNCTGTWIWEHDAYSAWIKPDKERDVSHVLFLSGPESSGKTLASALITKRLEQVKDRTYVAHYFFSPTSTKKNEEEKTPVQAALKYMAFQIARVDPTVLKSLDKECDTNASVFHRSANLESLYTLWEHLGIGAPGMSAIHYLVFDGIENLPKQQTNMLLDFVFSDKLSETSSGRMRVLLSGRQTDYFKVPDKPNTSNVLQIRMDEHNEPDMCIVVGEELAKRGMLEDAKPDSDQQRARDMIIQKLPQNVGGSYSRLKMRLESVISRLRSKRTEIHELEDMLNESVDNNLEAIQGLQRSLTFNEIIELNEILKWVIFGEERLTLEQLEAAMFLHSGRGSLVSLGYIIRDRYPAILTFKDGYVDSQDGMKAHLQVGSGTARKSSSSKEHPTIDMSITINQVDQEHCGHFFWDLAGMMLRDRFHFNLTSSSSQAAIAVDEFKSKHTIVTYTFKYLQEEPREETKAIGPYLVGYLPWHLERLHQLEDDSRTDDDLTATKRNIGNDLYELFKDDNVLLRHQESFHRYSWTVDEIYYMYGWLTDRVVMRNVDKKWLDEVMRHKSPTRGPFKELVKMVVKGFLTERNWPVEDAYRWIDTFMKVDEPQEPLQAPNYDEINWNYVSTWCQDFLELSDSELNSLWYERLAETAFWRTPNAAAVLSLYQCATEKANCSWLCNRKFGQVLFAQGRTNEAIRQMELAMEEEQKESATPKPKDTDVIELCLLSGQYSLALGHEQEAAKYYLRAYDKGDPKQVKEGLLGCLKAELYSSDVKMTRQLLKLLEAKFESGKDNAGVDILPMIAHDTDHDDIFFKMFTVARKDPSLLRAIVRAMEMATPPEESTAEQGENEQYAQKEARGVLLYHRGVAAYKYKIPSERTGAVRMALQLWEESYMLLSNVGGRNAFMTQRYASTASAQHYFQSMVDGEHLDHTTSLEELADADSRFLFSNALGFLGTVYVLRGKKEDAKAQLGSRMKYALQILSDDTPDNDRLGLLIIKLASQCFRDFNNTAIALSLLGQPDLVTSALYFEAGDITGGPGINEEELLDMVTKLSKEIIQIAKATVPDVSEQTRRIEAAKAHVDSLMNTASEGQNEQESSAHNLLCARLTDLRQKHTPKVDMSAFSWNWKCSGRTKEGRLCKILASFGDEFYHCIYCWSETFCRDCLTRLRSPDPDSTTEITTCSDKHTWLRVPPFGEPMYVGEKAKSVRIPKEVRPTQDDQHILEICFDESGGREITVEEWKEALTEEWST
ncbi:hypothetical protein GGR52DRAFT_138239 [Hypoxylon sp. FL1284]|nr:hypothetical protein GGR52DRAFT_138239 [Hypoxylon sp. FL1284]